MRDFLAISVAAIVGANLRYLLSRLAARELGWCWSSRISTDSPSCIQSFARAGHFACRYFRCSRTIAAMATRKANQLASGPSSPPVNRVEPGNSAFNSRPTANSPPFIPEKT